MSPVRDLLLYPDLFDALVFHKTSQPTFSAGWITKYHAQDTEQVRRKERLGAKWILLSSTCYCSKENFLIAFAQSPHDWRRISVSVNYIGAEEGSLQENLLAISDPCDRSACLYEHLQEKLSEINFYKAITNLKLRTRGGTLYVFVSEGLGEGVDLFPRNDIFSWSCAESSLPRSRLITLSIDHDEVGHQDEVGEKPISLRDYHGNNRRRRGRGGRKNDAFWTEYNTRTQKVGTA